MYYIVTYYSLAIDVYNSEWWKRRWWDGNHHQHQVTGFSLDLSGSNHHEESITLGSNPLWRSVWISYIVSFSRKMNDVFINLRHCEKATKLFIVKCQIYKDFFLQISVAFSYYFKFTPMWMVQKLTKYFMIFKGW